MEIEIHRCPSIFLSLKLNLKCTSLEKKKPLLTPDFPWSGMKCTCIHIPNRFKPSTRSRVQHRAPQVSCVVAVSSPENFIILMVTLFQLATVVSVG